MQSSTFDGRHDQNTVHNYERVTRKAQLARYNRLFQHVTDSYLQQKSLPVVCALDLDEDSTSRSRKWSVESACYAIDVEHATLAALRGDDELQQAWFSLLQGFPVLPHVAQSVIEKCGRFYTARNLDPGVYFKAPIRHGSVHRRAV